MDAPHMRGNIELCLDRNQILAQFAFIYFKLFLKFHYFEKRVSREVHSLFLYICQQ